MRTDSFMSKLCNKAGAAKDNTVPVVPSKIRIGPPYTAPKPSPATVIQRRHKKARRIMRRAA